MGTLIAVYLVIALVFALLCFGSVTYSTMYGKAPFGLQGSLLNSSAASLNSNAHELILYAGVYVGSAILLAMFAAYAVYLGLCWPVVAYAVWWKK